jgi:hypothetical protein
MRKRSMPCEYNNLHPWGRSFTFLGGRYETVEGSTRAGTDVPLPANWAVEEVESWLMIHATIVNTGKAVHRDTDFFSQGFDRWVEGESCLALRLTHISSLSATFLKNRIIGSLRSSSDTQVQESASRIQQSIIFSSPSIRKLARCVVNTVLPGKGPVIVDAKAHVENMIEKYSVGFEDSARDSPASLEGHSGGDHVVVLTGSTGGIGSYLLASLLQREDVSMVYAINRPSTALSIQQRQKSTFEDRGLDVTLLESEKLAYVETDTSHDGLGLDKELYQKVYFVSGPTEPYTKHSVDLRVCHHHHS